jgi:hypothetical protein
MRRLYSIIHWHRVVHQSAVFWAALGGMAALWPCSLQAQDWVRHNRSLALGISVTDMRYREIDTQGLTTDGNLNTERGLIAGGNIQGRWQVGNDAEVPLWMQGNIGWSQGRTAYQGYLQSGNQLTPYSARTGNSLAILNSSVGWIFPMLENQVQLIPHLKIEQRHWRRQLVQYGETYTRIAVSGGLLMQWAIFSEWVMEIDHQQGRQQFSHLTVPNLGFSASLDGGTQQQTGLGIHYQSRDLWSLKMRVEETRYSNAQSVVSNGLQAPSSITRHTRLDVAMQWHY